MKLKLGLFLILTAGLLEAQNAGTVQAPVVTPSVTFSTYYKSPGIGLPSPLHQGQLFRYKAATTPEHWYFSFDGSTTDYLPSLSSLSTDFAAASAASPQAGTFSTVAVGTASIGSIVGPVGVSNNQIYSGVGEGNVYAYGTSEFAGHELTPCPNGEPCPGAAPDLLAASLGKPMIYPITSWSVSGNVVTMQAMNNLVVGSKVLIHGITQDGPPASFNSNKFIVTAASPTSFSFAFNLANGGPFAESTAVGTTNFAVSSTGCGDAMGSQGLFNTATQPFFDFIQYRPNDVVYWNTAINDIGESYPNNTNAATQEHVKGCWRTMIYWTETPAGQLITGTGGLASGAITYTGPAPTPIAQASGPVTYSELMLSTGTSLTIGGTTSFPLNGTSCYVSMLRQPGNNSTYTVVIDGTQMVDPAISNTNWSSSTLYQPFYASFYAYTAVFDGLAGGVNHQIAITDTGGTGTEIFYFAGCYTPGQFAPNVLPRVEVAGLSNVLPAMITGSYSLPQYSDWYQMERDFYADAAARGMNVGYTDLFNDKYMNPATCLIGPADKHWTKACNIGIAAASLADMSAATTGERALARNALTYKRGGIISGSDFNNVQYQVGGSAPPYGFISSNVGAGQGRYYFGQDASRYIDRLYSAWTFGNNVSANDSFIFNGSLLGVNTSVNGSSGLSVLPNLGRFFENAGTIYLDSLGPNTSTGGSGYLRSISSDASTVVNNVLAWGPTGATWGVPQNLGNNNLSNTHGVVIPSTAMGSTGPSNGYLEMTPGTAAYGIATITSGGYTSAIPTTAACTPSATCVYKVTNCGPSGTAIGVPNVQGIVVGVSFKIASATSTNTFATGDTSTFCWQIN